MLAKLEMTKDSAEPGRSRTRNSKLKGTTIRARGTELIRELGSDVDDVFGKQRLNTTVAASQHRSTDK